MAEIVIKVGKRGKTRIPEETMKQMNINKGDFVVIELKHKAKWWEMLTPEALKEIENPKGGEK